MSYPQLITLWGDHDFADLLGGWTCQQASETVLSPWIPWQLDTSSTSLSRIATNLASTSGHASNTDADFTGGRGCERWIASEIYSWTVLPWLLTIPSCILFWIGRTEILQLVFKRSSNQAMKSHPRMIYGSNIGMTTCQVGLVSTFNFCKSQSSVSPAMAAITAISSKPSPLRNGRSMWIMLGYSWPGWPSWGSNWKYWKRRDTI